jgi:hypothetical protein
MTTPMLVPYEMIQFWKAVNNKEPWNSLLEKCDNIYKSGYNPLIKWPKGEEITVEQGEKVTKKNDTGNFTRFKASTRAATVAARKKLKKN